MNKESIQKTQGIAKASSLELIRNPLVFGLSVLFPLCFLIMFALLPDLRMSDGTIISGMAFGLPSILLFTTLSLALTGTAAPIAQMRHDGLLKALGMTPLTPGQFLLGQLPSRVSVSFFVLLTLLLVASLSGVLDVQNWFVLFLSVVMCISTTASFGILLAARSDNPGVMGGVSGMIVPAILFLSGGFLPFSMMPRWVEQISQWLPFTYIIDLTRHSVVGVELNYPLSLGVGISIVWSIACAVLAKLLFVWSKDE